MRRKVLAGWIGVLGLLSAGVARSEGRAEVGQSAFAAIAEAVASLDAEPSTDWEAVSVLSLREHLIDMEQVVLRTAVEETPIPDGVKVTVRGEGRALEALRRMVPMHVHMMRGEGAPAVDVEPLADGFVLELTTEGEREIARLRGLGFFGFLAAGHHHRRHHWALVSGAPMHH